ncbi:MAG: hypothetical protein RL414_297 [Actinomycetota bacterium]
MTVALALISGAFIGAVLGFVGAGGAMLSVPILIYLFDFTAVQATTAALAIVFAAAFAGVIPKMRTHDILYREALSVWAIGLITNIGGAFIARHLSEEVILSGFSAVLLLAGSSMLRAPIIGKDEKRMSPLVLIFTSLAIGAMTGIFGIGGGFLAIPVLVLFFHTPPKKAAGTSLLIITLNCLTSFFAHSAEWSDISWGTPLIIATGAVVVSAYASHFSAKVPAQLLKKAFAYLLFALAAFTLMRTWVL